MKRKVKYLICLIMILFNVLYSSEKVKLKKIKEIGVKKDNIYRVADLTLDEQGNIYITDMLDYSVKYFNKQGKLIKKIGRKGEGPKEFRSPGLIKHFNGKFYVTEQMFPGVKVFDKNLKFLYKIPFKTSFWDMEITSSNIIVSSFTINTPYGLLIINFKGDILSSDLIKNISEKKLRNYFIYKATKFVRDSHGNFYIAYNFLNKFIKLDKDFRKLWEKEVRQIDLKKYNRRNKKTQLNTVFKDIEIDKEGLLYILGGHYAKNPSSDIYIYDQNGNYIQTLTLEKFTHFIKIYNDKLYVASNDATAITIYEIIKK